MDLAVLIAQVASSVAYSHASDSVGQPGNGEIFTGDIERVKTLVESSLRQIDFAFKQKDWLAANAAALTGIGILGERYALAAAIDETGVKLIAADAEEKRGLLENAANIRRRMLQARYQLWQRKLEGAR